jgi:hypothetical protein
MPFPVGAVIGAGAGLASSFINNAAQKKTNKDSQQWNEKMFNLQGERDMRNWTMTNEYNSPQSQMKRLQEAGLNPNLVYGNGSAVNTASEPHASAPASWSPQAPKTDLAGPVNTYFNTQMQGAQLDNLKAQNTVLLEEAMLKKASTRATLANAGLSEFDLGYKTDMRSTSADFQKEQLRGSQIGNSIKNIEAMYSEALQSARWDNLRVDTIQKEANTRNINLSREQIEATIQNIKNDAKLKQLEIDLRKNGISSSDPVYMRIMARYLAEHYGSLLK